MLARESAPDSQGDGEDSSAAAATTRAISASSRRSQRMFGWRLPSPMCPKSGMRRSCRRAISSTSRTTSGIRLRGTEMSSPSLFGEAGRRTRTSSGVRPRGGRSRRPSSPARRSRPRARRGASRRALPPARPPPARRPGRRAASPPCRSEGPRGGATRRTGASSDPSPRARAARPRRRGWRSRPDSRRPGEGSSRRPCREPPGLSISRTVTSVTTPSVPSEPTNRLIRGAVRAGLRRPTAEAQPLAVGQHDLEAESRTRACRRTSGNAARSRRSRRFRRSSPDGGWPGPGG